MSSVHVASYGGRSYDFTFGELFPEDRFKNIGIPEGTIVTQATLTVDNVKVALAQHFDVGLTEFRDYYVEMNPNGNITVRPNTTFG